MGEMLACASGAGVMGGLAGNPAGEQIGCGWLGSLLIVQMSFLSGMLRPGLEGYTDYTG